MKAGKSIALGFVIVLIIIAAVVAWPKGQAEDYGEGVFEFAYNKFYKIIYVEGQKVMVIWGYDTLFAVILK